MHGERHLLDAIYAAATQPELWSQVVGMVARQWSAPRAKLYSIPSSPGLFEFTYVHNLTLPKGELRAAQRAGRDPFLRAAISRDLIVEGTVLVGEQLVAREHLVETEFYEKFWRPHDIGQSCHGVVFDGTDSKKAPTVLSLYRSFEDPPFGEAHCRELRSLLVHLSRALGVMYHLLDSAARVASTCAALDELDSAVLVLDEDLRIVFANRSATHMVARADRVAVEGTTAGELQGRRLMLSESHRHQRAELARLLGSAVRSAADSHDHFSNAMVTVDQDGVPRCVVHAAPLAHRSDVAVPLSCGRVIVFVYELGSLAIAPATLEDVFGLTRAEALAALEVVGGGTLATMAKRLDVSVNTLKTQLQAVYAKTMTHRQVDLLKVLLALSRR